MDTTDHFTPLCTCMCMQGNNELIIPITSAGHVSISNFPPANYYSPIFMDDMMCTGFERNLVNCSYHPRDNCDHREDIGLACIPADRTILPSKPVYKVLSRECLFNLTVFKFTLQAQSELQCSKT